MKKLILIPLFLAFTSCTLAPKEEAKVEVQKDEIFLMTYNLENLFDTQDDADKNDEEYLPRAVKKTPYYQNICFTKSSEYYKSECLEKDWSERVYRRKIARLVDVISRVNNGKGPDILVVQEIENIRALRDLANSMPSLNYTTVELIEGPDERGIDVGVISRLPLKSSKLHKVDFEEIKFSLQTKEAIVKGRDATKKAEDTEPTYDLSRDDVSDVEESYDTRGIMQVELTLPDGKSLYVLGAHLPSQRSPTGYRRVVLEKIAQVKAALPKDALVFAAGDFNISATEEVKEKLYAKQAAKDWAISHQIGCKTCTGTYYYHRKREWSFFDVFMFDKAMAGGSAPWQVDTDSIAVFNDSLYQINKWGSPARFGKGMSGVGVSDHWPLVAKLKRTDVPAEQKTSQNSSGGEE